MNTLPWPRREFHPYLFTHWASPMMAMGIGLGTVGRWQDVS